jgi:molybdopterin-guanine dinucleotide biosynthesis protein B
MKSPFGHPAHQAREIPVISFIGHHDVGKTRLLARLVQVLSERGIRVGAVKHAPHLDISEPSGTDSQELRAAGATHLLLLTSDAAAFTGPAPSSDSLQEDIQRLFSDCDLVLIEGLKRGPYPKIEVFRRTGVPQEPLAGEIDVLAVVTDVAVAIPDGTRRFSPRRVEDIADFLEATFLRD